jgi:hypothetical protein
MQWHTTYAAEVYVKDRQRELRQMAYAAHQEAKVAKKSRRFNLPKLSHRQNIAPITSTQNMTPVTDAR